MTCSVGCWWRIGFSSTRLGIDYLGLPRTAIKRMSVLSTILLALSGAGAVGALAAREHRSVRAARHCLLDPTADALDGAEIRHRRDGFPRLVGWHRGRRAHVELIPDTMVPRRLPQLWVSVTVMDELVDVPSLAVLIRPAGYEFYSLTSRLTYALDPPAALPQEILIRGSDARAELLLRQLTPLLAATLAEPRVKEVAVTSKGLRIILQACEGRRGEHLLLRQAVFDDASVPAADLTKLLEDLDLLRSAVDSPRQKQRAA